MIKILRGCGNRLEMRFIQNNDTHAYLVAPGMVLINYDDIEFYLFALGNYGDFTRKEAIKRVGPGWKRHILVVELYDDSSIIIDIEAADIVHCSSTGKETKVPRNQMWIMMGVMTLY